MHESNLIDEGKDMMVIMMMIVTEIIMMIMNQTLLMVMLVRAQPALKMIDPAIILA